MKLTFWGVRGSTPTVDRVNRRYGGSTPCVEIETPGGARFIVDCGTGLRALGNHWTAEGQAVEAHVFVSHYHWDHVQGIPFFAPFFGERNRFHFYGFQSEFLGRDSLRKAFEAQMSGPYFPVALGAMAAAREFREIAGGERFTAGDAQVLAQWLNHPQGCLGFRFETAAGTIVYATDNEAGSAEHDAHLRELAASADIFINDAQYAPGRMETHRGWGHSSWADGARMAQQAGARNLVLFHHDPDSSDEHIDELLQEARENFANTWAATEGMSMTVRGGKLEVTAPAGAGEILRGRELSSARR